MKEQTTTKRGRGKPRKFKTCKELSHTFMQYIEFAHINRQLPNVFGFCRFCDIHRETFYQQQNYYPDTFKKIDDILLDEALNNTTSTPGERVFYLKNKFGWTDRNEIISHNTNETVVKDDPKELERLLRKHNMVVLDGGQKAK